MDNKPQQIIELENYLDISLQEENNLHTYIPSKRCYSLNSKSEVIGLNLSFLGLKDISFFNKEVSIRRLRNFFITEIYNISFPSLKYLSLEYNKIEDLSPLSNLRNLKILEVNDNLISNIEPLKSLVNLSKLNLTLNEIENISYLEHLVNLETLDIDHNSIRNIDYLTNLKKLTNLSFSDNKTRDFSKLSNLTNLTLLSMDSNQIKDISFLKDLTNLTSLYIDSNQITDISVLKDLTNLTSLYIDSNQITDISVLKDLTNLTYLSLNNNQIEDISVLKNLTNLTYLNLNRNKIVDISVLTKLLHLDELYLYGNPIATELSYERLNSQQIIRDFLKNLKTEKDIKNETQINSSPNQFTQKPNHMNQPLKDRINNAEMLEIPKLLELMKNHYDKIPSHLKSTFNQLKEETKNQPNNFTLNGWKMKMLVLIDDFDFEIIIPEEIYFSEPINNTQHNVKNDETNVNGNNNIVAPVNGDNNTVNITNNNNYFGSDNSQKNTNMQQTPTNNNAGNVLDIEAFKAHLLAILAKKQHLGIIEILEEIDKKLHYDQYNRIKWVDLDSRGIMAIQMMAAACVQETKSLINSIGK